jgi:hypothetical protein
MEFIREEENALFPPSLRAAGRPAACGCTVCHAQRRWHNTLINISVQNIGVCMLVEIRIRSKYASLGRYCCACPCNGFLLGGIFPSISTIQYGPYSLELMQSPAHYPRQGSGTETLEFTVENKEKEKEYTSVPQSCGAEGKP